MNTSPPALSGATPWRSTCSPRIWWAMSGFRSSGAEVRGNSAFDIALWDLFGKAMGQPVAQLLGGFTRREIRTYNTCAGADYIKKATGQTTANYDLGGSDKNYDDLDGFLRRADELALSLLEEGITAHEDLAVRPGGRIDAGAVYIHARPTGGAGTIREDPAGRRRADRHHGGVPLHVAAPARHPDRAGPRAVRNLLARGPDPDGQPCELEALCRGLARPDLAPRRRWARAGPSATCWKRARRGS